MVLLLLVSRMRKYFLILLLFVILFASQTNMAVSEILPPLKQFNSGIAPQDVMCKENLELLVKFSDGRPICVKQTTKLKLIERRIAFIYEQHGGPQGNNEIKVTGHDAKLICDILKIPCPSNPSFSGVNLNEQIFVSYPLKGKIYDIVLNKTHACMTQPESKQTNCNVR